MVTLGIDFGTSYTFIVKRDTNKLKQPNKGFSIVGDSRLYCRNNASGSANNLISSRGIPTKIGLDSVERDKNGKIIRKNWKIGQYACECLSWCEDIKTPLRAIAKKTSPDLPLNRRIDKDMLRHTNDKYIEANEALGAWFVAPATSNCKEEEIFVDAMELAEEFFRIALSDASGNGGLGVVQNGKTEISYKEIKDVQSIIIGTPADEYSSYDSSTMEYSGIVSEILGGFIVDELIKPTVSSTRPIVCPGAEPVLGAIAYNALYGDVIGEDEPFLVIDLGGGTSDFTIVEKLDGKHFIPYPLGGTEPGGAHFTNAMKIALKEKGTKLNDAELNEIKERLFLSRQEFDYMNLLIVQNEQSILFQNAARKEAAIDNRLKKLYSVYKNSQKRLKRKYGDIEYWVAFSEKDIEECEDKSNDNWVFYQEEYNKVLALLRDALGDYLDYVKDNSSSGLLDKIRQIVFIGGTCNIIPLRDDIKEFVEDKLGKTRKSLKPIFYEIQTNNVLSDAIALTCSNSVAIGAAIWGTRFVENNIKPPIELPPDTYLTPTVKVRMSFAKSGGRDEIEYFKGKEFIILNNYLKTYCVTDETIRHANDGDNWPLKLTFPAYYYREGYRTVNYEIDLYYPDGKSKKYRNKDGRPYRFYLKKPDDKKDKNNDTTVVFLADRNPQRVAVFFCKIDEIEKNDSKQQVLQYIFTAKNGKTLTPTAFEKANIITRNLKMYSLDDGEEIEITDDNGIVEKKGNNTNPLDERLGFGWRKI